jgi:hypothetical protein
VKTIIEASEALTYAPALSLYGAALESAIVSTQFLIESVLGANRPLSPTKFTETLNLSGDGRAYLANLPILPIAEETPIRVKIRGGTLPSYSLDAPVAGWVDLDPEQAEIDSKTGELQILGYGLLQPSLYSAAPAGIYSSSPRRTRPTQRPQTPAIQIDYWAGFDFTSEEAEVIRIKQMFGQVLILTQTDAGNGVKRRKVDGEYEVEYQNPVLLLNLENQRTTGSIQLDNLLTFFHQYRPRSYAA